MGLPFPPHTGCLSCGRANCGDLCTLGAQAEANRQGFRPVFFSPAQRLAADYSEDNVTTIDSKPTNQTVRIAQPGLGAKR